MRSAVMRQISCLLCLVFAWTSLAEETKVISRVAFGSCVHQDKPQPIWDRIVEMKPDLFLLIGDAIYADIPKNTVMAEAYTKLGAQPGFRKLRQICPVLAVWDDHDYGINDGGASYIHKDDAKKQFLTFFGEPAGSPRWNRSGIYDAKIFGPPGKRVQVILLDGRYNRTEKLTKGPRGSDPNYPRTEPYLLTRDPQATFLGEEQWKWLEEQLNQPAEIRLICSGIQVLSEDHIFERWAMIPHERERLFQLLRQTRASGVIFLSGDRHLADLSAMNAGTGYTLYDLTASGLNQASEEYRPPEKNRHRVATMSWGNHFGLVEIDWTKNDPLIRLQIRDEDGQIAFQHKVPLSALQPAPARVEGPIGEGAISPREARGKIGERVTVEFKVQATGASGRRVFLNSERNRNDEKNFVIVLETDKVGDRLKQAGIDDPRRYFLQKTVRVTGEVSKYRDQPQIVVTDADQIKVVDK
jgi:alkaline phosphatase D